MYYLRSISVAAIKIGLVENWGGLFFDFESIDYRFKTENKIRKVAIGIRAV